jgi:uncharacterized Fe-S cluster-containing protein
MSTTKFDTVKLFSECYGSEGELPNISETMKRFIDEFCVKNAVVQITTKSDHCSTLQIECEQCKDKPHPLECVFSAD